MSWKACLIIIIIIIIIVIIIILLNVNVLCYYYCYWSSSHAALVVLFTVMAQACLIAHEACHGLKCQKSSKELICQSPSLWVSEAGCVTYQWDSSCPVDVAGARRDRHANVQEGVQGPLLEGPRAAQGGASQQSHRCVRLWHAHV